MLLPCRDKHQKVYSFDVVECSPFKRVMVSYTIITLK